MILMNSAFDEFDNFIELTVRDIISKDTDLIPASVTNFYVKCHQTIFVTWSKPLKNSDVI